VTTVVMARDYGLAAEVALRSGLGRDWLYPHDPTLLRGMVIQRVIYVEGWLHSTTLTIETAEEVQHRLAPDAKVVTITRAELSALEPPAPISAPFVETVAPGPIQDAPRPSRRRGGTPAWLWVLVVALGGSCLGALPVTLGRSWGWW